MLRTFTLILLVTFLAIFSACQEEADQSAAAPSGSTESKRQLTGAEITMLEVAAAGDTAAVKGLLDKGVDVNMRGLDRNTPIMEAAYAGRLETVKLLLDHGADLSAQKNDGETVLTLGARHQEIADLFKDVSTLVDGASRGDNQIVKKLIEKGTPVNGLDQRGQSALTEACWNGKTESVKLLLQNGADPSIKKVDGQSPLALATAQKHQEIAKLLNEASAKRAKETAIQAGK